MRVNTISSNNIKSGVEDWGFLGDQKVAVVDLIVLSLLKTENLWIAEALFAALDRFYFRSVTVVGFGCVVDS